METKHTISVQQHFYAFITPIVIKCNCEVVADNILILNTNTVFLSCEELLIYNIYDTKLVKCKAAKKKSSHGKMMLYTDHTLNSDIKTVLVIDPTRCMFDQFLKLKQSIL